MDIVLEDLGEDGEERVLEATDSGGVGLAGDAYRQAEGLKQVVVEVRLAGILEGRFLLFTIPLLLRHISTRKTVQVGFYLAD